MELNCPKCSSDQTQKITSIVSSGTTHIVGRTNSVGVAAIGGQMAIASSTDTTRTTSTSELAKKLAAPSKKTEVLWIPFILIMVCFGGIPLAIFGFFGIFILCGSGYWLFTILKKRSNSAKIYNQEVFPGERHAWENGFYCHRCEHSFVPSGVGGTTSA